MGNTKRLIGKHIYSSNRNKIQVNLVKQYLVDRKLRVLWGSDSLSTTQMISYIIVSGERHLMLSLTCIYEGGQVHYVESTTIQNVKAQLITVQMAEGILHGLQEPWWSGKVGLKLDSEVALTAIETNFG